MALACGEEAGAAGGEAPVHILLALPGTWRHRGHVVIYSTKWR